MVSWRLFYLRDVQFLELLVAIFAFVTIHSLRQKKHQGIPIWPFLGMLPSLVFVVRNNLYEWLSEALISQDGTFRLRGPWFSSLNCIVTCDPRNVEHLLKTRFSIYPKGSFFRDTVRDLLGDGIFNADQETWQRQRKIASVEFHSAKFRELTSHSLHELVHNRLLSVLETSEKFDLQDVLLRLTFDNICMIAFGVDPGCLGPNLPEIPFAKAFEDATEATVLRFVMPTFVWKLMRSLNLGTEKKLKESIQGVDDFAEEVIRTRKKELSLETEVRKRSDLLTIFMGLCDENGEKFSNKFLRDICVNFILAGRDTSSVALSWFFWLIVKNPKVEERIMVEICKILEKRDYHGDTEDKIEYDPVFRPEEIKKMDYLQAALCETLRLYPSVPVDHREIGRPEDWDHVPDPKKCFVISSSEHRKWLSFEEVKPQENYTYGERLNCSCCATSIFDLHRSCSVCVCVDLEICLTCCREIRNGELQACQKNASWKYINRGSEYAHGEKGSIVNTKKDERITCQCCAGDMVLKRILPDDWVSDLVKRAELTTKAGKLLDLPETLMEQCPCFNSRRNIGTDHSES